MKHSGRVGLATRQRPHLVQTLPVGLGVVVASSLSGCPTWTTNNMNTAPKVADMGCPPCSTRVPTLFLHAPPSPPPLRASAPPRWSLAGGTAFSQSGSGACSLVPWGKDRSRSNRDSAVLRRLIFTSQEKRTALACICVPADLACESPAMGPSHRHFECKLRKPVGICISTTPPPPSGSHVLCFNFSSFSPRL